MCSLALGVSGPALAQYGVPFEALQAETASLRAVVQQLQAKVSSLTARVDAMGTSTTESAFIRWGSAAAPAGATLAYSGLAFGGFWDHGGSGSTLCLSNSVQTATSNYQGDLLYPAVTYGTMPAGIVADRHIRCAVAVAQGPVTVIWGTSVAPAGWTVLYTGYALGAHYTTKSPLTRICVDAVGFDPSLTRSTSYPAIYAASSVPDVSPHQGLVKCAVIAKSS